MARMFKSTPSRSGKVGKLSRRLFPIQGLAAAATLLFVIGTAGFLSIEYLKGDTRLVVEDSLAGLCDSSLANAKLIETFNSTVLLVMADNAVARERYRKEFEEYNQQITSSVVAYSRSIFEPEDLANYNRLLRRRRDYLAVNQQILRLEDSQKYAEARQLLKNSLLPACRDYKSAAEKVMKYNAQEGKVNGEAVVQICTITQFVIAGAGIVLFTLGFLLGFFK